MRRNLLIAALLASTAITPTRADAGPVFGFLGGLWTGITTGVAAGAGIGGAFAAGMNAGVWALGFGGTFLGRTLLSIGLSAVAQKLQGKPRMQSPSERLVNFAQPLAPMETAVGTVRKGGPYAITTFRNTRRYYGVILAAHPIDAVVQWYLDSRPVSVSGNGEVETGPYFTGSGAPALDASAVSLRLHDGAAGQVADAKFRADIPGWTAAHDMAGLSWVAAHAKRVPDGRFSEVYGISPPTGPVIAPAFRGANTIYDPRTDSTGWTDNAALVWAWITTERLGGTVNWTHVAEEADICDQLVQRRDGGWQKRWTLNGVFDDATDYEDLRAQVIGACDGYMFERPDGSLGLLVGRWQDPEITLTEDDFYRLSISEQDWGVNPPTEFAAQYVEPDYDWLEAQSATWVGDPAGQRVRSTPQLLWCDSHNQTLRCLKRLAAATRPRLRLQGEIRAIGYRLLGDATRPPHRRVRVVAHGWDFVAEVETIRRGDSIARLLITGISTTAADHEFNGLTEEPPRPSRQKPTGDDAVPVPASISGIAQEGPVIRWTWPPQASTLTQEVQTREIGLDWGPSATIRDGAEYLMPALDGTEYEARVRNLTAARRPSAWLEASPVTAVADAVAPDALAAFSVVVTGTSAEVTITPPNDPRYAATRIYRADYDAGWPGPYLLGDAVLQGALFGVTTSATESALPVGRSAWWAVPINGSGIEGAASGPEIHDII